ncbi:hypothetical protein [Endozoicomonas sp. SCSIO W0465]|uniref:hypothetical protein n=1 Tax=Endozoicomonas sp. SCSIO W0465 TaxID=2918516 RepID=UPI002075281B|nr:hypothetical protein [Endozoicomonas sp. SCSIO W0465]USE37958.1 hypothetical protein MJO57_07170 [Endozoicomonas sp. SCSIO W0465]
MAEAGYAQLAVPLQPNLPVQGDQTTNASRTELTKEKSLYVTDSFGNTKLVREIERWELRSVHDRLFARPLGRQIVERNIANQNPQASHARTALSSLPIVISPLALIRNAAYAGNDLSAVWRALPDRSTASLFVMPRAVHVFAARPDLTEGASARMIIEVIAKVAQLVDFLTGESAQLIDTRQNNSKGHSASQVDHFFLSQANSLSELLGNLINSLRLLGRLEDSQIAMDLSRLEGKLSLALKDITSLSDPALLQEVDSLYHQYAIAAEPKGLAITRQGLSALLTPEAANALNSRVGRDGLSAQERSGLNNIQGKHELKGGEKPVPLGKPGAHEAVRPESGNKVGINTGANSSVMPLSSNQVTGSLNQLLAATGLANIAAQPLLAAESGPKQLPPIILPNANPGNRSDKRRKSRKELKEEEEKEREGAKAFFMFDDEPFEPFDDE